MTIGIAVYGPGAGRAALHALSTVEAIGRGAIGGFVSLATIDQHGHVAYATCQDQGTLGLFPNKGIPSEIADAEYAVLMSSGPNRPEPLESFTPGLSKVGLITGHRMPNSLDTHGVMMNARVLDLVKCGIEVEHALTMVLDDNPNADAGFLMLSIDHGLFAANSACVLQRPDHGFAIRQDRENRFGAGAIHNAIEPHKAIAHLAVETAIDHMFAGERIDKQILFREGTMLRKAQIVSVNVNADYVVDEINVTDASYLSGKAHIGIGFDVPVYQSGHQIGKMTYEPFMVVDNGVLNLIDGYEELSVSVRLE